ncbi:MAG: hypothetical protein MJK14_11925 [Rivularia sp. ALOHA_DT_140]|nr:hypothetical protein [Rivularia sp. ALOHA_DT_140]
MPAKKTTTTATKRTTTKRTTTAKKTPAKKTTTRLTKAVIEALNAKFTEIGGTVSTDGDRTKLFLEDRFIEIATKDLNKWLQEKLKDIELIYDRGEQAEWLVSTFPETITRGNEPPEPITTVTKEVNQDSGIKTETTTDDLQEIAKQQAISIIGSLNTPTTSEMPPDIQKKIDEYRGVKLKRDELAEYFDISPIPVDDMELCSQLSTLGIGISIKTSQKGKKEYMKINIRPIWV